MDNPVRQDIELVDFSAGILKGIASVAESREDLRGWRLYDVPAHAAAAEVFRRLQKFRREEYDLRFRIILGPDGRSGDWARAVRDELYLYRTLTQWVPDGDFDVLSGAEDLDRWLRHDGAPGNLKMWQACARRFITTYHEYGQL